MNKNKFFAGLATMAMAVCANGTSVFAANYTPVSGDNSSAVINKYLIVDSTAIVPDVKFNFAIEPGTAIASASGKMEVISPSTATGVTGTPTIASIPFAPTDTKLDTVASGGNVTLDTGKNYVKHNTVVDFSGVTFAEPGVYRWKVSETTATYDYDVSGSAAHKDMSALFDWDTQKGSTATAKERYMDVYVTDNGSGTLAVSSYVLHDAATDVTAGADMGSADVTNPGDAVADKSDGFVNEYITDDINILKEVTGNQGSKDKYFDFTVAITSAQPSTTYAVNISGAEATSGSNPATIAANAGKANVTSVTTDSSGAVTTHFYLKDGQNIVVQGLPISATYAITENAEDYKSTAGVTAAIATDGQAHTDATSGTLARADIATGYTNTRNGVIPTGVATAAAGALGLMAIGVAGLVAKRRKEED